MMGGGKGHAVRRSKLEKAEKDVRVLLIALATRMRSGLGVSTELFDDLRALESPVHAP
jgi:hypothetical protein